MLRTHQANFQIKCLRSQKSIGKLSSSETQPLIIHKSLVLIQFRKGNFQDATKLPGVDLSRIEGKGTHNRRDLEIELLYEYCKDNTNWVHYWLTTGNR